MGSDTEQRREISDFRNGGGHRAEGKWVDKIVANANILRVSITEEDEIRHRAEKRSEI